MFYRLVLAFVAALAMVCPSHSADYEVNLSVLESLDSDDEDFNYEYPLPVVAASKVAAPVKTLRPKPLIQPKNESIESSNVEKTAVNGVSTSPDENAAPASEPALSEQQSGFDTEQRADTTPADTEVSLEPLVPLDDKVALSEVKEIMPELDLEKQDNTLIENIAQPQIMPSENDTTVVVFDNDSYVLNPVIIQQLEAFSEQAIKQNPPKILIEAYHYDNGENSFARKRLSLNRAVTVRSYLLNKGHKSFSIKIINTEDKDLQNNTIISY